MGWFARTANVSDHGTGFSRGSKGGSGQLTASFVSLVEQAELHVSFPASWRFALRFWALRCEAAAKARWRPRSMVGLNATGCENTQRLCKTLVRQLKCTVSCHGSIGKRTLLPWRMGLTGLWMVLKMHSSYRLGVSELQDDKLSVPKPKIPCKTHGFLALCMLRSGDLPRLLNMLGWPGALPQLVFEEMCRHVELQAFSSVWRSAGQSLLVKPTCWPRLLQAWVDQQHQQQFWPLFGTGNSHT